MSQNIHSMMKAHNPQFIDLRFTDPRGQDQHVTLPVSAVDDEFLQYGKMIDGSSIKGWRDIQASDLILKPDTECVWLDPFYQEKTLIVRCDVIDPLTMEGYDRDPRLIAQRAEKYMQSTGIADQAFFGPEPEFFVFDDVRWSTHMRGASYALDSEEAHWNSNKVFEGGNIGHRPAVRGGYFPLPPVDSSQDLRSAMCLTLESLGMVVEAHHHEVATANQCEIATRFNSLTRKADEIQLLKYVVHNVAHHYGKTATFMPKPLVGDNGSGMHCHQSLFKDGQPLFAGDQYAGLSDTALYYIGGIIKHARALNAFTNPTVNSYKRLVPGFEAPVLLAYSAQNRSASIRIPYVHSARARRIEVRFPDPAANPYLAFAAMLMAGLDGIQHKIHPGDAVDHNLYELSGDALHKIPTVAESLDQAFEALNADHEFLLKGQVFSMDFIQSYMALRHEEIMKFKSLLHPYEFELYYSC